MGAPLVAAQQVDLCGAWRAAVADEGLRQTFQLPEFDDGDWEVLDVPGHWQGTGAFASTDGPLLYRRSFDDPAGNHEADTEQPLRQWLVFEGIFYSSDLWLDGTYLGTTEGYFAAHDFDVTESMAGRTEHELAVEVACDRPIDRTAKRNLTGVFQHWDLIDQDWGPGGIWRPVRLERSGPVRIRRLRVICTDADEALATLHVSATLDSDPADDVTITTTVTAPDGSSLTSTEARALAAGQNSIEWPVAIPDPQLWWPWSLGAQPLYEIEVIVSMGDGRPADRQRRRVGLRTVRAENWIFSINGERLFLKGSNQGPTKMDLAEATPADLAGDLDLAKDAGLDFLRVHAHISRPELYEAADESGVLLWQDMPLQWGYSRSVRREARRQAGQALDLLAHHASVFLWCGHNEPLAIDVDPTTITDRKGRARLAVRAAVSMFLPTWNKSVLDHTIARSLRNGDRSRPVVAHSGVLPNLPKLEGTDTHLYFGWYHGLAHQFETAMRWWPRLARFVTEFGAQAVPDSDAFMESENWPDLDWDSLHEHRALQRVFFDRHVPPADFDRYEEWKRATQHYQAELVKCHIETLRRIKYQPCGGFAQFCFADGFPSVTWSVLDDQRNPKAGFDALREACAPLIVVGSWLAEQYQPGDRLRQEFHVVSDQRSDLAGLELTVRVLWGSGGDEVELDHRRWAGEVGADAVAYVGSVDVVLPASPGPLRVELELSGAGQPVTNTYASRIG